MKHVISSLEAKELVKNGAQLIDVRTETEYGQGCLPGAANLPIAILEQRTASLDPNIPIIVYCRTGGRSAKAQEIMEKQGFSAVHNFGSMTNFVSD